MSYDPKRRAFMEKIRISVKKSVYEILIKDAASFGINKKNGEINRNEFINRLILFYYEEYTSSNKERLEAISRSLNAYVELDDYDLTNLSNDILKRINALSTIKDYDDESTIISFKPTKESETIISYIIDNLINNTSISSFFSMMFESYSNMVKSQRERIIFKDNYDKLTKAIRKSREVYVRMKNNAHAPFKGAIYALEASEEMYNYCLFYINEKIVTIRLSNIEDVKVLTDASNIPEEIMDYMDIQIDHGVQYTFNKDDLEDVVVEMTDYGKHLYEKLYIFRPLYYKVEGNRYYFKGSHIQILSYFKRFGKDGMIISPLSLRNKIVGYYKTAFMAYIKEKND